MEQLISGLFFFFGNRAFNRDCCFNAPYTAIAQIAFEPIERLTLAATYVHSRNQTNTETGTNNANLEFLVPIPLRSITDREGIEEFERENDQLIDAVSDSYNLQFSWAISDSIVLGSWGGLFKVTVVSDNSLIGKGTQDVWNWAATIAFPDLGKEGSLGGIVVGMEPWVTDSSIRSLGRKTEDEDISFHIEAFYQYRVNDNIAITPGIVWITAPDGNSDNEDLIIGTIRTTFTF